MLYLIRPYFDIYFQQDQNDNFCGSVVKSISNYLFILDMFFSLKDKIAKQVLNFRGYKTDRKIIVFESDDWGAIRTPSEEVLQKHINKDPSILNSPYNRLDTLESENDILALIESISKFKDFKGNNPVFTCNIVMGNPDFDKILRDGYTNYYHQHFFDTYHEYYQKDLRNLWRDVISECLIKPQFHAREHLNVSLWMNALQEDYGVTRFAFKNRCYLASSTPHKKQRNFLAAYWAMNKNDSVIKKKIIKNGIELFKNTFGKVSESFIACNFAFPEELEKVLYDNGIQFIQGQRGHLSPSLDNKKDKIRRSFTGKVNQNGQIYLVRNCYFEPSTDNSKDWVKSCLKDIDNSFRWNKPAIISAHRLNFVSGISINNRDKNIERLLKLFRNILNKWPDVEFLSTPELGKLISQKID